jgi:hypothetical protein
MGDHTRLLHYTLKGRDADQQGNLGGTFLLRQADIGLMSQKSLIASMPKDELSGQKPAIHV